VAWISALFLFLFFVLLWHGHWELPLEPISTLDLIGDGGNIVPLDLALDILDLLKLVAEFDHREGSPRNTRPDTPKVTTSSCASTLPALFNHLSAALSVSTRV
jgi:hypothetical protein